MSPRGHLSQESRENIRQAALSRPPVSDETRQKLSSIWKGKKRGPISAEHREKIRQAGHDRAPISEETRQKMSAAHKGHKMAHFMTPEVREHMRQAALKRPPPSWLWTNRKPVSEETRAKLSAALKKRVRKPVSQETREKMRQAKLKNPTNYWLGKKRDGMVTEAYRAKMSAALMGRPAPYSMRRFHYNGCPFRSTWEVRVAKALDVMGVRWEFETKRFDLGSQTYAPDFYLPDEGLYWEVKGYFGPKSQKTVTLFRQRFPETPLVIIDKARMLAVERAAEHRSRSLTATTQQYNLFRMR